MSAEGVVAPRRSHVRRTRRAILGAALCAVALAGCAGTANEAAPAPTVPAASAAKEVPSPEQFPTDQAEPDQAEPEIWTSTVDQTWARQMAERTGIPLAGIRAYAAATLTLPAGCTLGWNTLAGVGWVESQHGTLDGRLLDESGHSDPVVIGPALDGTGGFAAIRTTRAATARHGDSTWDHAYGPMQFIDSTWRRWGRDGDGDGVADPGDLDDAAATAAAYLCADGRDLTTPAGWSGAILSYNKDPQYVQHVFEAANRYASAANGF